uniref:Uncharacterized protein n=2 Tax=Lygus hesperus TaxID=30085 RepID=A0A146L5F5_LYGHE
MCEPKDDDTDNNLQTLDIHVPNTSGYKILSSTTGDPLQSSFTEPHSPTSPYSGSMDEEAGAAESTEELSKKQRLASMYNQQQQRKKGGRSNTTPPQQPPEPTAAQKLMKYYQNRYRVALAVLLGAVVVTAVVSIPVVLLDKRHETNIQPSMVTDMGAVYPHTTPNPNNLYMRTLATGQLEGDRPTNHNMDALESKITGRHAPVAGTVGGSTKIKPPVNDDPPTSDDFCNEVDTHSSEFYIGAVSAYLCALLYLSARIPQVYHNYKVKKTDSILYSLFILPITANW